MKTLKRNSYRIYLMVGLFCAVTLYSCEDKCQTEQHYTFYEPVYTPLSEIRASVKIGAPKDINESGKIYIKDSWLFINEPGKGIHVVDNADPANPVVKSFITIPGNYDLSIKGNILYADSYIDLIAFDILDKQNVKIVKRLEGIFSNYNSLGYSVDPQQRIVTNWISKEEVKITQSTCKANFQPWGGIYYDYGVAVPQTLVFDSKAAIAPGNSTGIGGSTARFTIEGNYLYMIDAGSLQVVNIQNTNDPTLKGKSNIAWDIETIFPYNGNLFMGSQTGMYIFGLTDPEKPTQLSLYSHIRRCDPVVVENDLAYVTLRSGTTCQGFTNQLDVIDVKDLKNPVLLKSYPMVNPHGLGIDNKTLFICDGDDGLKVYDATDRLKISENQLAHYKDINTYDVIPYANVAIMVGKDGIYQFDYANLKDIKLLSKLMIVH